MHKKLVIIGASGHGKVVADIALKLKKYDEILFLDDNQAVKQCVGIPVVGGSADAKLFVEEAEFFVAIGNTKVRERVMTDLINMDAEIPTLIHPMAIIGEHVQFGAGCVVMAGAVVNSDTEIGQGCIINTSASVDHDCKLSDYVHVSVGAHVCGTVNIGERTWVGAGAIISNNINVCSDSVIGAGAVVVKNIEEIGVYVGVPARRK